MDLLAPALVLLSVLLVCGAATAIRREARRRRIQNERIYHLNGDIDRINRPYQKPEVHPEEGWQYFGN